MMSSNTATVKLTSSRI
uniref:Uncharacterized protein n=1 Tax=Arundo donax TaxID=35708 RepID=A0A0A9C437_ARUDO